MSSSSSKNHLFSWVLWVRSVQINHSRTKHMIILFEVSQTRSIPYHIFVSSKSVLSASASNFLLFSKKSSTYKTSPFRNILSTESNHFKTPKNEFSKSGGEKKSFARFRKNWKRRSGNTKKKKMMKQEICEKQKDKSNYLSMEKKWYWETRQKQISREVLWAFFL